MLRIASVNVNGVRAAFRKGMGPWLDAAGVDVLALQEVRAEREDLLALLGDDWVVANDAATAKGGHINTFCANRALNHWAKGLLLFT